MSEIYSIAFYNLENLFDYKDNEFTLDKDFTPNGIFNWDKDKYFHKIDNLSLVISEVGAMRSDLPPIIIGVCEVENETCLNDLINAKNLKPFNYQYVFHKSSDQRGINVAFLYQEKHFEFVDSLSLKIDLLPLDDHQLTRDILLIKGKLFGEKVQILVNHWPSRTDGTKKTNFKRIRAAQFVQNILADIYNEDPVAKLIIMGDFNDEPTNNSIHKYLNTDLLNPMIDFQKYKRGSVRYKGKWMMFDQIIINKNLVEASWFEFKEAHIFVNPSLVQKSGKYKGAPKRTFIGNHYQGGYSDHYPVFIYFQTTLNK